MSLEYGCYCDNCHQMVSWTSDKHDGNSCPNCDKVWIRPLPKPNPGTPIKSGGGIEGSMWVWWGLIPLALVLAIWIAIIWVACCGGC